MESTQSTLHLAAQRGYARAVARLLDEGADIDQPDGFGVTPLAETLLTYSLLQVGGIHIENRATRERVQARLVDTMIVLLERGADLQHLNDGPCGPLTDQALDLMTRLRGLVDARALDARLMNDTAPASGGFRAQRL